MPFDPNEQPTRTLRRFLMPSSIEGPVEAPDYASLGAHSPEIELTRLRQDRKHEIDDALARALSVGDRNEAARQSVYQGANQRDIDQDPDSGVAANARRIAAEGRQQQTIADAQTALRPDVTRARQTKASDDLLAKFLGAKATAAGTAAGQGKPTEADKRRVLDEASARKIAEAETKRKNIAAGKQEASRESEKALSKQGLDVLDDLLGPEAAPREHPGMDWGTGWSSFTGSIPGTAAADFKAKIDRLNSVLSIETLARLKGQSSTGATGFGNLSDKELAVLQNSTANLSRSQSKPELRKELARMREVLKKVGGGAGLVPPPTTLDEATIEEIP